MQCCTAQRAGLTSTRHLELPSVRLGSPLTSGMLPAGIDFRFSDPGQGFDARAVRGTVGKLIDSALPLAGAPTATALEVAAGGALYQARLLASCTLTSPRMSPRSHRTPWAPTCLALPSCTRPTLLLLQYPKP